MKSKRMILAFPLKIIHIFMMIFFGISAFSHNHFLSLPNAIADRDLEVIRERVRAYIMTPAVDVNRTETVWHNLAPDGFWPGIDYEDVSSTGFQHSDHLANMIELALAYKKPGSRYTGNKELKRSIHSALDFWIENDFICENWWWNEMGTPLHIINLMMIMDDELTDLQVAEGLRIAGRAHMGSTGARPGGDMIRVATIWGKQGLYKRDADILEEVISIISSEIKTTTGRGLKPDLSHHHRTDNVISTLSYGMYLPGQFSVWALFIEGTRFSFPPEATELLVDFFLDGVCRSMAYARYPDPGAKNRDITRIGALNPSGPEMAENLYRVSHYRKDELRIIADIREGISNPGLRYTSFFWHSEYFIHQRQGWYTSVRMHSERNNNVESPYNGEGLKNHHYGDGSNFLTITGKEYFNIFPVWNWQRIPGTTVVQKPRLPHWEEIVKAGRTSFVGGVTDEEYGAAAFNFESAHDPLLARKSWFFFDDEYVALGSNISSEADFAVNTTISQRYLNEDVFAGRGNIMTTLSQGQHVLEGVSWIHHDNVAYIFPLPGDVYIRNTRSTGSWREINSGHRAPENETEADLFTLWLDHGIKPRNGSYEYIVVPGMQLQDVRNYNQDLPVRIIANSGRMQAVRHDRLGISQVVFYEAGKIDLGQGIYLSADRPCMVMVRTDSTGISRITVSDPLRKNDVIVLTVNSVIRGRGDNWSVARKSGDDMSIITIGIPRDEWAGKSVVLDIRQDR
jgi:chondroitin AC lyase